MAETYTVKPGDTLLEIAYSRGVRAGSLAKIYDHPQNETLRAQGGELNVGDQLFIPDKEPKTVELQAFGPDDPEDAKYTFVVKTLKLEIALTLEDDSGTPYANETYELQLYETPEPAAGQPLDTIRGTTQADGHLEAAVAPTVKSCIVTLPAVTDEDSSSPVSWRFTFGAA